MEIEGDGFTGACCWGSLGRGADGGCFVTTALGTLGAGSADFAHEMDIGRYKGAVRYLFEREISAEFMVGRVSAGDVEVNRF